MAKLFGSEFDDLFENWDRAIAPNVAPRRVINGTPGNDWLFGSSGNDQIYGGKGMDVIYGREGDDFVDGGEDRDVIFGGSGNDTQTGDGNDILWGEAGDDDLYGEDGNDILRGGSGKNLLDGGNGDDDLRGGDDDDVLRGGNGADRMFGGLGNDTFTVDNQADEVTEWMNSGLDTVQSLISYTLGANVENLTLVGDAKTGAGNALNNVLTGNAQANTLWGLDGNDTIDGQGGNDTINGGMGADVMSGGLGDDTFTVNNTADLVIEWGGEGKDTVQSLISYTLGKDIENLTIIGDENTNGTGNALNNVLAGNAQANTLMGLGGNDTIDGGNGADVMFGGLGNDIFTVNESGDVVTELSNEGTDTVRSLISYTLGANVENLTIIGEENTNGTGNALNNVLTGNAQANTLRGLGGNDTIDGGNGRDTMFGGLGNDIFFVDNREDVVTELSNEGTDTVKSLSYSYRLGANVENLTLLEHPLVVYGTGNALDNVLIGNAQANYLWGSDGKDRLYGGGGNDELTGWPEEDWIDGGTGRDTLKLDTIWVDFTVLDSNRVKGIEMINLFTRLPSDNHIKFNLSNVMAMHDPGEHGLRVFNGQQDNVDIRVELARESGANAGTWSLHGERNVDGDYYNVYVHSANPLEEVLVEQGLRVVILA